MIWMQLLTKLILGSGESAPMKTRYHFFVGQVIVTIQ